MWKSMELVGKKLMVKKQPKKTLNMQKTIEMPRLEGLPKMMKSIKMV